VENVRAISSGPSVVIFEPQLETPYDAHCTDQRFIFGLPGLVFDGVVVRAACDALPDTAVARVELKRGHGGVDGGVESDIVSHARSTGHREHIKHTKALSRDSSMWALLECKNTCIAFVYWTIDNEAMDAGKGSVTSGCQNKSRLVSVGYIL
jgi:hypothetical protein